MVPALGLGLLLRLLGDLGAATKVLHSMHYLHVAVSEPSPGIPQYMEIGFVDGIPFTRYDNERGRVEPLTEWVKDSADPEYWERETQIALGNQHINARNLETLRERYNQSGEPPDVHVSGREEHGTLILSCHVYGFYPNTIAVSWMKGGETLDQETEWGGIVPNSDGTFHTWARIEALPEEREQYRCRVEHPGMPEPGIFTWEPTSGGNLTVMVAVSVIAAILILIILIGFGVWKLQSGRRDWKGYNPAAGKVVGTNGLSKGITA